ncbi:LysM domain containing protein [Klebsormidium nitens]|uniref:LysM domain containing protein n=1 Tax=Klebsormidium nitens TaxID=105231 RepID=A0A1Y1I5B3_KLENI|nr:LysM domain containing protein [Klebsormidium nitens]|eukprot:GAQ86144.1 LysM domain containing protein [Klebsormidium nitens]
MALNVVHTNTCQGGSVKSALHAPATSSLISTRSEFLRGSALTSFSRAPDLSSKSTIPAGKVLARASAPKETYYTVQKGDSLYRIAKQHDVKLSSLANANSIRIARRVPILPGQQLKIPGVKDRASLNEQERQRMAAKLKRIAETGHLSSTKEQLRASLVPRVPAQKANEVSRRSNVVASVAVDSRPAPSSSTQALGGFSLWQPAGVLLLLSAAFFYITRPKQTAAYVDPSVRKAQAVERSKLNLKPADLPTPLLPPTPPKPSVIRVEASAEGASTEPGTLRYSRVGSALFAVGSPRVLETMLSSRGQEVEARASIAPPQYEAEKAEARKVLEERLAAARAAVSEGQRRAELARERAQQAEEAKEAVWGTVERIRELSSINEEVLRVAEQALAEVNFQKELASTRNQRR